jgi:hypothetical protein
MDLAALDLKVHPFENRLLVNGDVQVGDFQRFSHVPFVIRASSFF